MKSNEEMEYLQGEAQRASDEADRDNEINAYVEELEHWKKQYDALDIATDGIINDLKQEIARLEKAGSMVIEELEVDDNGWMKGRGICFVALKELKQALAESGKEKP